MKLRAEVGFVLDGMRGVTSKVFDDQETLESVWKWRANIVADGVDDEVVILLTE